MELRDVREEEARKLRDKIEQEGNLSIIEELVKDNKIPFEVKEIKYQVRLLTLKEKEELDTLKRQKFGELLRDKTILLQAELIKEYKERGIDIEEIHEQMKKIDAEIFDKKIKLGEAISKNESESILKAYEQEIHALLVEKQVLITRESMLLELCLENKLLSFVTQAISYLSLDKLENNEWKRVFNTFDEYARCEDEDLLNKAGVASIALHYA